MEKIIKNFFKSSLVASIVLMILGILLVFQSEATIFTISYIIGGILVAIGVLAIINFIKKAPKQTSYMEDLDIIYGVVCVILGILIITNPGAIASIIPIVVGIGIIINSCNKLQYAFQLRASDNNVWKSTMVISIISALCGIILIFNPFQAAVGITRIVGIFIIIYAILDIISTITIRSNVKKFHEAIEETIKDAEIINEEDKKHKNKKDDNTNTSKKSTKKSTKRKKEK